ncbi:MAG: hypothetical protein ACRDKJ_05885 [Actinomycetota bacterium]
MTDQLDTQRAEAFAGRLFEAAGGAMDTFCVYLGDRLGLYRSLASGATHKTRGSRPSMCWMP